MYIILFTVTKSYYSVDLMRKYGMFEINVIRAKIRIEEFRNNILILNLKSIYFKPERRIFISMF